MNSLNIQSGIGLYLQLQIKNFFGEMSRQSIAYILLCFSLQNICYLVHTKIKLFQVQFNYINNRRNQYYFIQKINQSLPRKSQQNQINNYLMFVKFPNKETHFVMVSNKVYPPHKMSQNQRNQSVRLYTQYESNNVRNNLDKSLQKNDYSMKKQFCRISKEKKQQQIEKFKGYLKKLKSLTLHKNVTQTNAKHKKAEQMKELLISGQKNSFNRMMEYKKKQVEYIKNRLKQSNNLKRKRIQLTARQINYKNFDKLYGQYLNNKGNPTTIQQIKKFRKSTNNFIQIDVPYKQFQ